MKWGTAILAAVWLLGPNVGVAQEQVLSAKTSFVFNGERVRNSRDTAQAPSFVARFAQARGECGEPCIALQSYGIPIEYDRYFEANREFLSSPDKIQTGQRLIIPA